jgi:hypothetical protein
VEINGWNNPNPQPIVPAVSEFESTSIEEIANIYTVQNPISAFFVNVRKDTSYVDISNVFGRLESDEIDYSVRSSSSMVCRANIISGSDSIMFRPGDPGSCTMTLTGDVNSYNLVNKFPVFVWEAPEGWWSSDVGMARTDGFVMKEGDLFTIGGSADAASLNLAEGFHLMYRSLEGDAKITARISSVDFPTMGGMGGIVFKSDSLDSDSEMARLVYSGEGMARFESRNSQGDTINLVAESAVTLPFWIRLEKEGPVLKAQLSDDGETWNAFGSDLALDLGDQFSGGLLAGSSDNNNLSTVVFEHVTLVNTEQTVLNPVSDRRLAVGDSREINLSNVFGHAPGQFPVIAVENSDPMVISAIVAIDSMLLIDALGPGETVVTLSTGTEPDMLSTAFTVMVTEALDPDWIFEDIGMPLRDGYASRQGEQTYAISTFGDRISGTSDQFSFLYKEKSGAQQIVARIDSIEDRGSGSQAGIMFRESTDPGSLYMLYSATAYGGIQLKYRWDDDSQPEVEISDPEIEPPYWLRLRRDEYNYFSASYSLDSIPWTV